MSYDFQEQLKWSKGECLESDCETLKAMIPGAVDVRVASTEEDKGGTDYFVTLRKGTELKVDAKNRRRGVKLNWLKNPKNPLHEEELTLEKWSMAPCGNFKGKTGWTLCEKRNTDLILYKFHPEDSTSVFLVSFPLLRIAFRQNIELWEDYYGIFPTPNAGYTTKCIYVPVSDVFAAINRASVGKLIIPPDRFQADLFPVSIAYAHA